MIQLEQLRNYFPFEIRDNAQHQKYFLKEYLQLSVLDFLSTTMYIEKIVFIGGTNLRLVKGIDRFSEDLDFDCKALVREEFIRMTDAIVHFLQRSGWKVETRDYESERLKAYRRSIYFPELLFNLGLTGHREERFLLKIESQDQKIRYERVMVNIRGCGFYFPFPVPTDGILCSMKLSALLSRAKGRDFYDAMFLLAQARPDFSFLAEKEGIHNMSELKAALAEMLKRVDLNVKKRDFEHLLFNKENSRRILAFADFISELK